MKPEYVVRLNSPEGRPVPLMTRAGAELKRMGLHAQAQELKDRAGDILQATKDERERVEAMCRLIDEYCNVTWLRFRKETVLIKYRVEKEKVLLTFLTPSGEAIQVQLAEQLAVGLGDDIFHCMYMGEDDEGRPIRSVTRAIDPFSGAFLDTDGVEYE